MRAVRRSPMMAALALATGFLAGCGSSATGAPTATEVPSAGAASAAAGASSGAASIAAPSAANSPAVTAAASPAASVAFISIPCSGTITTPSTSAKSPLTQTYPASFTAANVGGIGPGAVQAEWFKGAGGSYVVWFAGLCKATAALCPGSSLKVGSAFQDIANAPTGAGGCDGDSKYLAAAPAGVQVCAKAFVFFVSKIPDSASGTLYASVEKGQPDGTVMGLTSAVPASATIPTIDLSKLGCSGVASS